jgi:hypothetical protein
MVRLLKKTVAERTYSLAARAEDWRPLGGRVLVPTSSPADG